MEKVNTFFIVFLLGLEVAASKLVDLREVLIRYLLFNILILVDILKTMTFTNLVIVI